jgi:hypothetical protein
MKRSVDDRIRKNFENFFRCDFRVSRKAVRASHVIGGAIAKSLTINGRQRSATQKGLFFSMKTRGAPRALDGASATWPRLATRDC